MLVFVEINRYERNDITYQKSDDGDDEWIFDIKFDQVITCQRYSAEAWWLNL